MTTHQRHFRELAIQSVERLDPRGEHPIQLSGGVDSATILAAQLARGFKPHCYTWQVGNFVSRDVKVARLMCKAFELKHTLVTMPIGLDILASDVRRIVQLSGATLKTAIQCGHPYLYMTPRMVADGYSQSHWGLAGGCFYGDGRKAESGYNQWGQAWFDEDRRETLITTDYRVGGSTESADRIAAHFGHSHLYSYLDRDWCEFACTLSWAVLNKPYRKVVAVEAFPEFWKRGSWYRPNESYQIVSGLWAWHDTLVASPHNKRGSKSVVGVYRDLCQGLAYTPSEDTSGGDE